MQGCTIEAAAQGLEAERVRRLRGLELGVPDAINFSAPSIHNSCLFGTCVCCLDQVPVSVSAYAELYVRRA